jgi:hypothetical protein
VGEYLVCAELGRRGYIATSFTGNVPEFDILAIDANNRVQPIQVKAIRQGQWQFDASRYIDITLTPDGRQIINGKRPLNNPGVICVFVRLVAQGQDEFYIFRLSDLQEVIFTGHSQWLAQHGGRRPKNPESMHVSVSTSDLAKHRDNWGLLNQ